MRRNIIFVWQVGKWILRFELLDLLRGVSVVSLFPRRFVGSVLIVARSAVHVVTPRSALVLFLSAPPPNDGLEILSHSRHIPLSIYICLLLEKFFQKQTRTQIRKHIKKGKHMYIYEQDREEKKVNMVAYKGKRESRRVEHGFGERLSDKARLSDCTGGHVVVGVTIWNISHYSGTATAGTILKKTPKTHQRNTHPFLLFQTLLLSLL